MQGGYVNNYQQLEDLLLNAVEGTSFQNELMAVCDFYKDILPTKFLEKCHLSLPDIHNLLKCQQDLMQQMKHLLLAPETNADSERSALAVRRICTYCAQGQARSGLIIVWCYQYTKTKL